MAEVFLAWFLPWLLSFLLVAVVVLLGLSFKQIKQVWLLLPFRVQLVLLAILLVGGAVRWFGVPNQQRILFDEDRYLAYAEAFARFNQTVAIDLATPTMHLLGKPDQAVRTTVPVINGWMLKASNHQELPLFYLAKFCNWLQIILLFGLAWQVTRNRRVALIAAGLLAVFPVTVYWAGSTAPDSYFVFFTLLTMVVATWYARQPHLSTAWLLVASVFLLLCVRVEAVLLFPLVASLIVLIRYQVRSAWWQANDRWLLVWLMPFLAIRLGTSLAVIGKKWCCAESLPLEAFSLMYLIRHLLLNLGALFGRPEIPVVLTIAAGLTMVRGVSWRVRWLSLWFWLWFGLYSSYYAGKFFSYEFSGSYGRFFLSLVPPFLILAAIGIDDFGRAWQSWPAKQKWYGGLLVLVVTGGLSLATITQYPHLISQSPYFNIVEAGPVQLRTFLLTEMLPAVPPDAVVIHNLTAATLMSGRSSLFFGTFLDDPRAQQFVITALQQGQQVYSIEAPQCVIFPDRCKTILQAVELVPVVSPTDQETLGYMELKLKTASPSATVVEHLKSQ